MNEAIRIGSPESPVLSGMPVPGKPGKYYEKGQFAPSMDELVASTLSEADKAGLISTDLPIFDENGEVSADMVETWNPKETLGSINVSDQISKFSMAVVVSVNNMFPDILNTVGITSILSGNELEQQEGSKALIGESLLTVKSVPRQRSFASNLYIYDRFYQFISTPVVAEIPGRTKGISVSMYALLKGIGHVLFNKLSYDGQLEMIGKFLSVSGWVKIPGGEAQRGSFMGRKNMSSFYRKESAPTMSEIARYSPIDDFADTFAHYLVHRSYLGVISPEKLEVMDTIAEYYRMV